MLLAVDGVLRGIVAVADRIKETTPSAIRRLRAAGLEIIMATGDSCRTAEAVARELGIEEVRAEISPAEKAALVEQVRARGVSVAMAGDGVNDAPALAGADVGIAMGTGADAAVESAGVTLVKGDLGGIARARLLAQGTMRNIRQNLFFAFVYNAAGVPVAAGRALPDLRGPALTDARRAGDEPFLGLRHRQFPAFARDSFVEAIVVAVGGPGAAGAGHLARPDAVMLAR